MLRLGDDDAEKLAEWAGKALHGLDQSTMMMGVLDDRDLSHCRPEFVLQVGHCLLTGKPLVLAVPFGIEIPERLETLAAKIVRYDPTNPKSMTVGMTQALTELGINKQ